MLKVDARHVFQAVNLIDGLVGVAALGHLLPFAATLGSVAATQAMLAGACLCPRCPLVGPVLTSVVTARPYVGLTFDDGPNPALTPWVLDTLAQYDAKASFFCIGTRARHQGPLLRSLAAAGHSVENHSESHNPRFALSGSRRLAREIDDAQATLADLSGRAPRFFRAPSGFRNPWLAPLLHERNLCYAAWSHRGFDTLDRAANRVLRRLTSGLQPGSILLMHDGRSPAHTNGRRLIHAILPTFLQYLDHCGWKAVDLPTLIDSHEP